MSEVHGRDVSCRAWRLWLVFLLALGAAVRAWQLGTQSLWLDEAQFLQAALEPTLEDMVRFLVTQDFHPPVYPLMLRYWVKMAGTSDAAVRTLPLLLGLALIPLTAALGRLLTDRRDIGLLAAAVVALNGYHLYLSQEGRHYTWLAAVGLANVYAFVKVLHGASGWIAVFVATGILGLFSHYHMAFVLAGCALLAMATRRWRVVVATAACAVVFVVLWAPSLRVQLHRRSLWGEGLVDPETTALSAVRVVAANLWWTVLDFSTGSYLRLAGRLGFDAADVFKLAVGASAGVCAVAGARSLRRQTRGGASAAGVLACAGGLPIALAVASGFLQANVYETKYVSFAAPLWAVVLGAGCARLRWRTPGRIAVALFLVGLVVSVAHYHLEAIPWKEDWRQAATVLSREWSQGDLLLQRAPYTRFALDHYMPFQPPRLRSGGDARPDSTMAAQVATEVEERGADRLWVVLSHDERAPDVMRVLEEAMPLEEEWMLQGIRMARFAVRLP